MKKQQTTPKTVSKIRLLLIAGIIIAVLGCFGWLQWQISQVFEAVNDAISFNNSNSNSNSAFGMSYDYSLSRDILIELKNIQADRTAQAGLSTLMALNGKYVAGEGLTLIGESGSGKSSLLRIIAGLMPYKFYGRDFEVEIKYNANAGFKSVQVQEIERKERYGILQLVLQDTTMTLITEVRIKKSLALICTQKGMNNNKEKKEEFEPKAREWMAHLDLSWDELVGDNKRIVDLSLGMMRRFSLLRAFLLLDIYSETDRNKPKLLLLDEISRGLDAISLNLVISGLNKFCRDNNTNIIAVSHDVEFVSRICNRAIMIYKGQILEEFDARLLSSKADRQKIYAKLEAPCYYERFFGDDI